MVLTRSKFDINAAVLERNLCHWLKYDHLRLDLGIAILLGIYPTDDVVRELNAFVPFQPNRELLFFGIDLLNGDEIRPRPPTGKEKAEVPGESVWDFCTEEEIDKAVDAAQSELRPYVYSFRRLKDYWNSGEHPQRTPLTYFVEWAKSKDEAPRWLKAAEEMKLISNNSDSNPKELQSSRVYVSDKLAILNQASQKWWANADREDRTTHPSNKDVEAWLLEHGLSGKLAKSGATTIRPEWAPSGRKPKE